MTQIEDNLTPRPRSARELGIMQGNPPPPEKRPSLTNWDLAPFNRWTFQHIEDLFPIARVGARSGGARPLADATADLSGVTFTATEDRRLTLADHLAESYTDAFMVLHRGRVITETYFNDQTPLTRHLAQSVSKSLVGALVGVLHGDGLIDLQAPVSDVLPELAQSGYGDARIWQVLDMRSGVRFTEDYNLPGSDMTRIDMAAGWRPTPDGTPRETIRSVIASLPRIRPHGQSFSYRSIETDLLAWVCEHVTDMPLPRLLSERIWQPVGAEADGFFTVDSAGTALADGGFCATLRDFARFGEAMRRAISDAGDTPIPHDWARATTKPDPDGFDWPYTVLSPKGGYRRQWWVHDRTRGDIMARGVFGQLIYIDAEAELTVVKLSTWPDYLMPGYIADTMAAIAAIRQALADT
ncbi:serine hydrolase domain-containing protein [Oceanomicrobium pacificus]|uniref:Serine hydrolase n=1 Tax=Oceanomicrobium pacificus TaxID=2692916 RepID=A0A6B0TV78_9RHOB|nr:serine hydrolase [Oceanomicrobium pacificus]MXU65675.1 serine hydrolase [Oceanomicrobium pacificus]